MSAPPGPYSSISRTRRPSSGPRSAKRKRSACQPSPEQSRHGKSRDGKIRCFAEDLAGTAQKLEQATADYDVARAAVTASEATIEAQRQQLNVLGGQQGLLNANVAAAEAALTTARLRLGYTRVVAPVDGVVGERDVQEGDYVNVGSNLITVVPLPEVYVTANYKETQLTHVAPGQPVEVKVDMFPEAVLQGRVARLSPASGATFALLPPDNATGNFTKVVQRIPIRIEFEPGQSLIERLRPGMSVVTRVHVYDTGQKLAQTDDGHGN